VTKTCCVCKAVKPATREFFPGHKKGRFGLASQCKPCKNAACARSHKKNDDPETERARAKAKYARRKHTIAFKQWQRTYMARPEVKAAMAERGRRWAAEHPEWIRAKTAKRRSRRYAHGSDGHFTRHDLTAQLQKQGGCCFWCSADLADGYHADHLVPLARGGDNTAGNIVCSCGPCNQRKHAKLPSEFFGVFGRAA
jgi:5-methylcytosine-specific restriction endonuclease McrA